MKTLKMALCAGRHPIPQAVDGAIFPSEVNPLDLKGMDAQVHSALKDCDSLDLYVTGLSVALVAVIQYCYHNFIALTLWHFNRDTGDYYPQIVSTREYLPQLVEAGYIRFSENDERWNL